MINLIVRGGQVVTPSGVGAWDVVIQGERIAAVTEPGAFDFESWSFLLYTNSPTNMCPRMHD